MEIALFTGLIIAGYLTRLLLEVVLRKPVTCDRLVSLLAGVVYNVLIPLAFFSIFSKRGLLPVDLYIVFYFIVLLIIAYAVTEKVYKGSEKYVAFMLSAFPNSVFLGFPVCYVLFGNVDIAALLGALTVVLNVMVPDIIARRNVSLRALLSSTALLGFAAGLAMYYSFGTAVANIIHGTLRWSTDLLSYTATFTMGLRIPVKLHDLTSNTRFLLLVGVFRFIIAPLASIPVALITGFHTFDALQLAVVSGMPPAVINVLVAQKYNWYPQLAALVTTILTAFFLVAVFPVLVIIATHF